MSSVFSFNRSPKNSPDSTLCRLGTCAYVVKLYKWENEKHKIQDDDYLQGIWRKGGIWREHTGGLESIRNIVFVNWGADYKGTFIIVLQTDSMHYIQRCMYKIFQIKKKRKKEKSEWGAAARSVEAAPYLAACPALTRSHWLWMPQEKGRVTGFGWPRGR